MCAIKKGVGAYFNPRLREGGDSEGYEASYCGSISIHASAREATINMTDYRMIINISIHASAREATC